MKKVFIIVLAVSTLFGCEEKTIDPIVEVKYELRFTNTSDHAYSLALSGDAVKSATISSGTYVSYQLEKGFYKYTITQLGGYVFSPTVIESSLVLSVDREIVFP